MSRVHYPAGVERGARVKLLRELRTKGGDVFKAGEILVVGSASCSARGRKGRPRVDLWDPEVTVENGHPEARGVRQVEREAYVVVS